MRSEWKSLGIPTIEIFRISQLNMTARVIFFIIADSADDFHPSCDDIATKIGVSRKNVPRYTNELKAKKFLAPFGHTQQGWIKWQIVIDTVREALQLSHQTSLQIEDSQITSLQYEDTTVFNLKTPCLQFEDTNLQRNLQRNLQNISRQRKPPKVKKPPSQLSLHLANLWYEISTPSENHDKDKTIEEWARHLDLEQRVTKYSDGQMTQLVKFRNQDEFWRDKGAIRPGGLSKKGKDGIRKSVKIFEQSNKQIGSHRTHTPVRLLRPGELPF